MTTTRQAGKRQVRGRKSAPEQPPARSAAVASLASPSHAASAQNSPAVADLQAALDYLREGDVFIVHSLDRLSQAMEDLRTAVLGLTGRGLVVDFIKDLLHQTGPDQAISKRLIVAIHAISELQREMIRNQQQAAQNPVSPRKGRKPVLSTEQSSELRRRAAAGEKKSVLAQEFGISRDTLYRYLGPL